MREHARRWGSASGAGVAVWFVVMLGAGTCLGPHVPSECFLGITTAAGWWVFSIGTGMAVALGILNRFYNNAGGRLLLSLFWIIGGATVLVLLKRFVRLIGWRSSPRPPNPMDRDEFYGRR